jgi:hypothetical protein
MNRGFNMTILWILNCFFFGSLIPTGQVHSQSFADSPWPMFGHDPGHTHRSNVTVSASNTLVQDNLMNGQLEDCEKNMLSHPFREICNTVAVKTIQAILRIGLDSQYDTPRVSEIR